VASNSEQLRQVLDTLRQKRLILIDTAGMSQRDVRLAGQFETLRVQGHKVRTVLTLSAATEAGSLRDMLEAFRSAAPKALIFTKIDEATTLGPMLSLALKSGLPLAYLSAGQRVPEDLYVAGRQRAWLIQKALRLAQNHTIETHEDELAEQFADLGVAANA
jgi:flagellar biosynthesis protein FlhF